jgi:hypothetical protein
LSKKVWEIIIDINNKISISRKKRIIKDLYIYSYNIGNKSFVIEDKWNWNEIYPLIWNEIYPLIRIDLSHITIKKEEEFEDQMELILKEIAKEYK